MTLTKEIRGLLKNGQELFALTRNEYLNLYQWIRRDKLRGKDAGIIGCRNGEYLIWHEDYKPNTELQNNGNVIK